MESNGEPLRIHLRSVFPHGPSPTGDIETSWKEKMKNVQEKVRKMKCNKKTESEKVKSMQQGQKVLCQYM